MADIKKALQLTLFEQPFFATILLHQDVKEDNDIPTMAVDGSTLRYNSQFVEKLSMHECAGVLAHEAMHLALAHHVRARELMTEYPGREEAVIKLWNIATDAVINAHLRKDGVTLPQPHVYREGKNDHEKTSEQVFYELLTGGADGLSDAGLGDVEPCVGDVEQARLDAHTLAIQAHSAAKMAGAAVPSVVSEYVDSLTDAKVNWRVMLRRFLTTRIRGRADWTRPNRRRSTGGIILPSNSDRGMPALNCIFDTSASVSSEEFRQFLSEMNQAIVDMNIQDVVCICCDTEIRSIHKGSIQEGQLVFNADGRGGTNMTPALEYLHTIRPAPTICFSDMEFYRDAGPVSPGPMLWCRIGTQTPPSWGELIDIKL